MPDAPARHRNGAPSRACWQGQPTTPLPELFSTDLLSSELKYRVANQMVLRKPTSWKTLPTWG